MGTLRAWLVALGVVCSLSTVHLAAVPTDTVVVAMSEPVAIVTEPTATEEPAPPIKLTEMDVTSKVSLRYAHTAVVAHFRNPAKKAQEAHFRVLLPETAFISGFVMTINEKSYKAYVKEKEEAKQIYQDAVSHGFSAAHIATKARDSNNFFVSVNVEPTSSVMFNLTYEELLVRRNGFYHLALNMHPGAVVPKFTVTVHISESEKITELRIPEVRTGNEIDATKDDPQNTKAVIERGHDDREATITFKPDLEEQRRLMTVYAEKSKESASHTNSFSLNSDNDKAEGVLGQFVVQYDVDRSDEGTVLVNDGYFVHFFAPKNLPVLNKYVIFVLDTSGSMMGRKIEQLREAMLTILSDLKTGDYFNIVEFASYVTVHDLKEADQEPPKRNYYYYEYTSKPTTLVAPSQATPTNIDKAKVIVSRLDAMGGTNIAAALDVAVSLNNKRFEQAQEVKTNSSENASTTETNESSTEASTTEVALQSSDNFENVKGLEPIVIFLTDGDPTVGETNPSRIITLLSEKNYGPQKATIFSLAFGEDADKKFLRKISLRNDGFMRHIYEGADAHLQLTDFYRQVSSPLLANVKFSYPADQIKSGTVTKDEFRTFYAGSEVVVAGQLSDAVTEFTPELSAFCGVAEGGNARKKYEKNIRVPVAAKKQGYLPLERLWAYLSIKQLLDKKDAADASDKPKDNETSPEKKALNIALKYEFVTPLTSLVVVKPNETSAVDAESVDNKKTYYDSLGSGALPMSLSGSQYIAGGAPIASYSFASLPRPASYPMFHTSALSSPAFEIMEEFETVDYHDDDLKGLSRTSGYSYRSSPLLNKVPLSAFSIAAHGQPYYDTVDDYDDESDRSMVSQVFSKSDTLTVTTTVPPPLGLQSYHLEKFTWAEPLLNTTIDALVLHLNETVTLKLTKDATAPKSSAGDTDCANAVNGGEGACVYLTRCTSAQNITADEYKSNYCLVNQEYAGVCCPKNNVDTTIVA